MLRKVHSWVIQTRVYHCSTGPRGQIETATCTGTFTPPQRAADLHHSAEATHAHIPAESAAALAAENRFQDEIIDVLEVLA